MTSELIARLERATAADQHVLIYDALKFALEQNWTDQDTFNWAMQCRGIGAFLDAAMVLVPEGWPIDVLSWWPIIVGGPPEAHVRILEICPEGYHTRSADGRNDRRIEANAATPALALCIAALRARGTAK